MRAERMIKMQEIMTRAMEAAADTPPVRLVQDAEVQLFDEPTAEFDDDVFDSEFEEAFADEVFEQFELVVVGESDQGGQTASDAELVASDDPKFVLLATRRPSLPPSPTPQRKDIDMAKLDEAMKGMREVDGYVASGIVDSSSGMPLASDTADRNFAIDAACAANTDVVRAKLRAMEALGLGGEAIEDILITLGSQYHLIRPLRSQPSVFCYLAVDRSRANLAMSRLTLNRVESKIHL